MNRSQTPRVTARWKERATAMMGVNHATSGAAAWIAATGAVPYLTSGAYPLDPVAVVTGSVICAGAALLPDADHHNATIAHSVPIVGRLAAGAVGAISGGHRHGAHSLVAAAIVGLGAWALTFLTLTTDRLGTFSIGTAIGSTALVCFAVKARDMVDSWLKAWMLGAAFGLILVFLVPSSVEWFPLAVVVGFVAHLAGDFLTTGGLPGPLWPIRLRPPAGLRRIPIISGVWMPSGHVALPVLGNTGSARELALGLALALYVLLGVAHETLRGFGIDLFTLI
ncbi:metal-dependent hydrolase [Agromyces badenianii]|uniref:metal-dependent hydrolase n=1 Tax=Agromyces badenianii TaxID=2080742 RepID=UPI00143D8DBC|nr:metal-dependent hydrolase [Agromyces badenianii]